MWTRSLDYMLRHLIHRGALSVEMPSGEVRRYGEPEADAIHVRLTDPDLPRKLVLNPDLALGEAYVDGRFQIQDDDLRGFMMLIIDNRDKTRRNLVLDSEQFLRQLKRRLDQYNPASRSKSNVAHHYDLNGELYDLFLDEDKQYSCAFFSDPDFTLEQAQAAKKKHIAEKLLLKPGMRVLDIGCGWGGMALTLARDYGVSVLGVTLSEEQHKIATERARRAGLSDRVEFRIQDYREIKETFDRIVSIGMFEHVGVPHYRTYFNRVHDMLTEDGVALIHTIGRNAPPGATSPWIAKYIFPGGYVPSMSEVLQSVEREDLWVTDVEVWRLHYAFTLREWHDRFVANIDRARELYDEQFCRMWRYYLIASELSFRYSRQIVYHFQLARRLDAVPLTRDYLYRPESEQLLQAAE